MAATNATIATANGNEMKAKRMQNDALARLKELRKAVRTQRRSESSADEIVYIQGGGELHFVNTIKTRAYYLVNKDSWLYLERENDGSSNTLYVVRKLPDGRILTKAMVD
ncbi:hypothetical protein Tcan_04819 [Toxocara canis]|uniref:Uncharacterized protein n=1 Tax=Toxocara canis TaxID=6265 RepID=A0A0B2UI85_TOXCA|nr:hypothetical protein Tcan_04819 [Toxocara canis]